MVSFVQKSGRMGGALNSSFLALVPKEVKFCSFEIFLPISLCDFSYKIINKIMAKGMQHILPKPILENQG